MNEGISAGVSLSPRDISLYRTRGFLALPSMSTAEEVHRLKCVFEQLFAVRAGRGEGNHYGLVGQDGDSDSATLPSIINPVNYATELRHLVFRRNAFAIAKQLFGPRVTPAFEQVILKVAEIGSATPWHQDEAYRVDASFAYEQISFWMPLAATAVEDGCMHYIPQSNHGPILPHHSFKDDPGIHAIECIGKFDASDAVACPLSAGSAVIHDGKTLHYSGPNSTGSPRYAYILAFEVPPRAVQQARDFHWNREKKTRNKARRSNWRKRGGIAVEAIRKYRLGMLNSPSRILFELRRGVHALSRLLVACNNYL